MPNIHAIEFFIFLIGIESYVHDVEQIVFEQIVHAIEYLCNH